MSTINFQCGKDVVTFCEARLNEKAAALIIKKGKEVGLSNTAALDKDLSESNYIPVLKAIWSERSRERRLEWLRSKFDQLHAPLLYEQSIAEFVASPTVETANKISIPLMRAASFRVQQDAQCSKDASVCNGDASLCMETTYQKSLDAQVQKYLNASLGNILSGGRDERIAAIRSKVLEVAKLSLSNPLPKPDWVGWHGMSVFLIGNVEMHPASEHKQIRDGVARKIIESIEPSEEKAVAS